MKLSNYIKIILLAFLTLGCQKEAKAQDSHNISKSRTTPKNLSAAELKLVNIYKKVDPTVVTIFTSSTLYSGDGAMQSQGQGSGVLISNECHILTAAHVVDSAKEILVKTSDGKLRKATLLFSEKAADLALLELDEVDSSLPHAKLGNSDELAIGQSVYALGSPYGLEHSFSAGIISGFRGFNRLYNGTINLEYIQTDAAINSGNSGGPLFNSEGEIIGITSSIITRSGGFQGIGMVVAINTAKDLLAFEDRPWIGVESVFLSAKDLESLFNIKQANGGLLVQNVAAGSPAEKAGLKGGQIPAIIGKDTVLLGGDLILEIADQVTCHLDCVVHASENINSMKTFQVKYLRSGTENVATIDVSATRRSFKIE